MDRWFIGGWISRLNGRAGELVLAPSPKTGKKATHVNR
jgi:hypothetical protein